MSFAISSWMRGWAPVAAAALLHCGSPPSNSPVTTTPPSPIKVAANTWTWVDVADSVCDDGSQTGIGVNFTNSSDLLIYLSGGGACWDLTTCFIANTATHGPFGSAQFSAVQASGVMTASVLDRAAPNPFGTFNMVFVPYCTGDLHGGDAVVAYGSSGSQRVMNFKGHVNMATYLARLAATFPNARKVVVAGSSAGGYGSALNYDLVHTYFPKSKLYLLDDSGPTFIGDAIIPAERAAWFGAWNLTSTQGSVCPVCVGDLSALPVALAKKYPTDRMALLSYTQDATIQKYLNQDATAFQANLYDLAAKRLDLLPLFHYYFVTGTTHTFLLKPGATTAQGIPLWTWLTQFVSDDAAWISTKP